ncbi:MAG: VWA domain-containing protein [Hyphomicrobium sp.]|nr:VWA domain-containing protein [Hyphomicrobium sp.]
MRIRASVLAGPNGNNACFATAARSRWAAFKLNAAGDVALMFGLITFALFMFIGAAVDLGRWINARTATMDAIDAAVLAAGRALQTGASQEAAKEIARQIYLSNTTGRFPVQNDTINFDVRDNGTTVVATGYAHIQTPFMGLAAVGTLPLFVASEAPEAKTAQNSAANYNREVALMLDVSGSMCTPCSKRDDMRAAAKDLVDIMMVNNDKTAYWSKIAIVAFSGDVRPPAGLLAAATDPAWPSERSFTYETGSKRKKRTETVQYPRTECVAERNGDNKYTDAGPGAGNYVMSTYTQDGECVIDSGAIVSPLSLDKTEIKKKIDALMTGGGTAGHLGTAWAYYMLSPKWNAVLPLASQASSYDTPKLKKIAVLMTDGEYNLEYDANGVDTSDNVAGSSANSVNSAGQAIAICNEMKKSGIDVFTVGFDLGGNATAINTMNKCASDASKSYTVATGEQLRAAFRDIAIRTTELHLSK